ncbi:hypothetical protein DSO57_1005995 [Entomophthora muscae]|uniref:Uncharacterized protein n=1 Tax=Entomophthora muscae TaxID=34485 RepID=A0ACC2SKJ9_9FUNG|nr:hypothetical protein DSO57_1005995 [Entomophthora muscae]
MTLRGQVLPVGGIREKVIAAHRAGILNLDDLPRQVMDDIEFHFVDTVPEALNILFKPMFKLSSSPKFSLLPNL